MLLCHASRHAFACTDALRQDKDEMEHKKDLQIAMKDAEIAEQKRKMDQMASEFGQMLKVIPLSSRVGRSPASFWS